MKVICMRLIVRFGDNLKKKKTEEPSKEKSSGPQPPPGVLENVVPEDSEAQDPIREQKKIKKKNMTAQKKTIEKEPFQQMVPEMRITISTLEKATLFSIQSTEEQLRPRHRPLHYGDQCGGKKRGANGIKN